MSRDTYMFISNRLDQQSNRPHSADPIRITWANTPPMTGLSYPVKCLPPCLLTGRPLFLIIPYLFFTQTNVFCLCKEQTVPVHQPKCIFPKDTHQHTSRLRPQSAVNHSTAYLPLPPTGRGTCQSQRMWPHNC